jgi:hypothetical protein
MIFTQVLKHQQEAQKLDQSSRLLTRSFDRIKKLDYDCITDHSESSKLLFILEDKKTEKFLTKNKYSIILNMTSVIERIAGFTCQLAKLNGMAHLNKAPEPPKKIFKGKIRKKKTLAFHVDELDYPIMVDKNLNKKFPLFKKGMNNHYLAFVNCVELMLGCETVDVLRANDMLEWASETRKFLYKKNKEFMDFLFDEMDPDNKPTFSDPRNFFIKDFGFLISFGNLKNLTLRRIFLEHLRKFLIEICLVTDRMTLFMNFMMNRTHIREKILSFGYYRFLNKIFKFMESTSERIGFIYSSEVLPNVVRSFMIRVGRNGPLKSKSLKIFGWSGMYYLKQEQVRDRDMTEQEKKERDDYIEDYERRRRGKENWFGKVFGCCLKCCGGKGKFSKVGDKEERERSSALWNLVGEKMLASLENGFSKKKLAILRKTEEERMQKLKRKKVKSGVLWCYDNRSWVYRLFVEKFAERGEAMFDY